MISAVALAVVSGLCQSVVISEVMYHPYISASPDEFVEIINLSDSVVNLAGWSLADLSYQYPDTFCGEQFLLEPGYHAVIFESDYDTVTGIYRDILPQHALILSVDDNAIGNGLSNSGDTLFLINRTGDTLDVMGWNEDITPGYSLEKAILDSCAFPENWRQSEVLHGTPGSANSIAGDIYDLSLSQIGWLTTESPNHFRITATIENKGISPIGGAIHLNGMEVIQFSAIPAMESGEISFIWVASEDTLGLLQAEICLLVPEDHNPANDCITVELPLSAPPLAVVVNEIMYHPLLSEPEWIELVNTTNSIIQLKYWILDDLSSEATFPAATLYPGDYAIVTGGDAEQTNWPYDIIVIHVSGFPSLNNTGDEVRLHDATSITVDEVDYSRLPMVTPGRSLEKTSPLAPSNESTSWVISPATSGHTAGAPNSIFHEPSQPNVTLEPNPIRINTPNSLLIIQYTTPYPAANLLVEIYDLAGRRIGTVTHQGPHPGTGVLTWDARNLDPFRYKTGQYILLFQARNAHSAQKWEQVKRLIIVN
jgi:hypothetical protein